MNKRNLIKQGLNSVIPVKKERLQQENIAEELQLLIDQARATLKPGRPAKHRPDRSTAERGCKEGETRYSVVMKKEHIEKLKDIAYWQRGTLKEALSEAIEAFLKQYEKKNGTIKTRKK